MSGHYSLPLFRPLPASAVKPQQQVIELRSAASPRCDGAGAAASQAACELWLALHLPRFMLDALGDAIAALGANTAAVFTTAATDTDAAAITKTTKRASSTACIEPSRRIEASGKKEADGRLNAAVAVVDL